MNNKPYPQPLPRMEGSGMICRLKTKPASVGLKVHQTKRPVMTEAEQLMLLPLQGAFLYA